MLLGTPVIATIHGGHADLCSPEWCWPVEFRLEQARTHLTEGRSFWAEPDIGALASRMREVYESDREVIHSKTTLARKHIAENFTWAAAAQRHERACARVLGDKDIAHSNTKRCRALHIGFVTTWNARCGIAEYSRYLSTNLPSDCRYSIFANKIPEQVRPDESNVCRSWSASSVNIPEFEIQYLTDQIRAAGCDAVSIQYNFGLFPTETVRVLIRRLRSHGIPVVLTLHSTANENSGRLFSILKEAGGVIVHRAEARDQLQQFGLERVHLQRHGIYTPGHLHRTARAGDGSVFTVSCHGFFLPPKGIYELLQAFSAAAFVNPALRLKLINAVYDIPESNAYASKCISFLQDEGLSERVLVCADFLDQDTIVRELADSDLVILPYTHSTESSSGAVCLSLASLTPMLCSDLEIFREFADIVHFFPARDIIALANRIVELSTNPALLRKFEARQRQYVKQLSWGNVAQDFQRVIVSCLPPNGQIV